MKNNILLLALLLILLSFGQLVIAAEISVGNDDNIQSKIDNEAQDDDVLLFEPGEYELNLQLNKNITLQGRSTKDVIFRPANPDQPIISVDSSVNADIQNITFLDAKQAILVRDSAGTTLEILNNVFHLGFNENNGLVNVAIETGDTPGVSIQQNVFYENDIAVKNQNEIGGDIQKNIFEQNIIEIDNQSFINVDDNCFGQLAPGDTAQVERSGRLSTADIGFVDEDNNDFHLTRDSDCVENQGSNNEVVYGAYGGDQADGIPAAIEIQSLTSTGNDSDLTISLEWSHNGAREITGYKIYHSEFPLINLNDSDSREDISVDIIEINSATEVNGTLVETISGLAAQAEIPAAPVLTSVLPRDRKLLVQWTAVDKASLYWLYYTGRENDPIDDPGTSLEISGLDNNVTYDVWVKAESQLRHYFQIAAYTDESSDLELTESFFIYADKFDDAGEPQRSEESNKISRQPEMIVAYPALPNEGCFIATAAFGYYSANEVLVLRQFRDQYLLTNTPGQAFVAAYYKHSPYLANYIEHNNNLKTLVRWALLPIVTMLELLEYSLLWFMLTLTFYCLLVLALINRLCCLIVRKI